MMTVKASRMLQIGLLATAVALTGCPALDTTTRQDPNPSPSASIPPGGENDNDNDDDDEKEPTLEVKTIGLVSAKILTSAFEITPDQLVVSPPDVGLLLEKGESGPGGSFGYYEHQPDGTYRPSSDEDHTHTFHPVLLKDYLSEAEIAIGGIAPTKVEFVSGRLVLRFPPNTDGDLTIRRKAGSKLAFESPDDSSFGEVYTFPGQLLSLNGTHDATASLGVSVSEVDGTPCTGLTKAHFTLWASEPYSPIERMEARIAEVQESKPGQYQLTASFASLSGWKGIPRKLTLKVSNPRIEQEVTP